jgi:hypothetical protein
MADITNVINVTLLPQGAQAARDNMNVVACFTSQLGVLSSANRTKEYKLLSDVATDFGTTSAMYEYAKVFFAQTPNAVTAGGKLFACFWRAADESVAATSGTVTSIQHSEATLVGQLQSISDGAFDIDIDSGTQNITALDFRTSTTLEDIATVLDTAITGATVAVSDQKFVITSSTTGATSLVSFATDPGTGTYVGDILAISDGSGAVKVDGEDADTLTAETKETAYAACAAEVNFKGFGFIDNPTDAESRAIGLLAQADSKIFYDVFNTATNLEKDVSNVVWDIVLSKITNIRMLYSKANNRKLWIAYASRAHTVNFNAENSALTMNLKELSGITAEDYTEEEVSKAKTVGLDIYTTIKDTPKVLTSGANDFVDNVYNLIAYVDAVQTDLFNLLGSTSTKISQTTQGVNQLVDQAEKTTKGFVKAGVFAPGTWSSTDRFGDSATFDRNIEQNGYYILAGLLADQTQADREARKSPVIQSAVKNAGAIHSVEYIINFNK